MIWSVPIFLASRAPHKTHVAHVLLISAFPRPEGEQFRVSTGRNTWYSKPWNYPGESPRGAVVSRTPPRDVLIKEQGRCHSLLNTTVTPVSRYFNKLFGSRPYTSLSASSPLALSYARVIKQRLTSSIDFF